MRDKWLNKKAVWEILNGYTIEFIQRFPNASLELIEIFKQERNDIMISSTGNRYYAWEIG